MKKFKEIVFLKNLKRVGNAAINGKYNKIIKESQDVDDLILKIQEIESKFSLEDLQEAKEKSEGVFNQIIKSDIDVITVFDDNYPKKLEVMKNSKPAVLYVKGNIKILEKPNIAVIGTRKPSKLSQEFEENLVKNIVNTSDKVIVSGLALGCDKIAHETTVDENKITMAVLPSFVEDITPASNKKLAQKILDTGGCLISEYEPGTKVYKSNYVNRDKIVAAFCDSILVVECGEKSGTMHTVQAANKFERQIFAFLPDNLPKDSFGGNKLILTNKDAIKLEVVEDFVKITNNSNNKKISAQQTLF